jgi:radical SAM-linked protein
MDRLMSACKIRLRFAKRGDLRLVSHHDLMRCLERMARRAELPIAHGQGFNPRPKIVFTLALGLGIEGRREVVELDLAEPMDAAEVLRRLSSASPPGFEWLEAEAVASSRPSRAEAVAYALAVPEGRHDAARAALSAFLESSSWPYTRRRSDRDDVTFDLRPFLIEADLDPRGVLRFRLKMTPAGSARSEEVIDALGLRDLLETGTVLVRTEVELVP